tara:strand:+ start:86 stop:505 length:420 start_codon:yes stop_codon:yes gene_type:complete
MSVLLSVAGFKAGDYGHPQIPFIVVVSWPCQPGVIPGRVIATVIVLNLLVKDVRVTVCDFNSDCLHQQYILSMIPLKAWYIIHAMQVIQARRITLSMNGSLAGSVSIQHVRIVLIMLTPIASAKPTKILRPTLCRFEHS